MIVLFVVILKKKISYWSISKYYRNLRYDMREEKLSKDTEMTINVLLHMKDTEDRESIVYFKSVQYL